MFMLVSFSKITKGNQLYFLINFFNPARLRPYHRCALQADSHKCVITVNQSASVL